MISRLWFEEWKKASLDSQHSYCAEPFHSNFNFQNCGKQQTKEGKVAWSSKCEHQYEIMRTWYYLPYPIWMKNVTAYHQLESLLLHSIPFHLNFGAFFAFMEWLQRWCLEAWRIRYVRNGWWSFQICFELNMNCELGR